MFFSKRVREADFISHRYDPTQKFVTNLYDIIYFPPFNQDQLNERNIHGISKALYKTAESVLNNANYQLYQIPGTRKYFGEQFLHGFNVRYMVGPERLVFENLDDTKECYQYTKEMCRILEVTFQLLLENANLYIYYEGEKVRFITESEFKALKKPYRQNRIVWLE